MKKYREFWILEYEGPRIEDGDLMLGEVLNPESYPGNKPLIHVINKKAYDDLVAAVQELLAFPDSETSRNFVASLIKDA